MTTCPAKALLFLVLLFSVDISAQVIGDEALQKAQSGNVSFLEGSFITYLSDTVSPEYARLQLEQAGFEILDAQIEAIQIMIFYGPDDSTLNEIEAHPLITNFQRVSPKIDTAMIEQEILSLGIPMSQREEAIRRMIEAEDVPEIWVTFDWSVNENGVKEIMGEFRDVPYGMMKSYPRTVTIKAEPGKEPDVMAEVEKLPFVESTAMVAVLEE